MYTLSFNIHDRAGTYIGHSSDEVLDRLCDLMCNHYDDYFFENKIYDMRYTAVAGLNEFERYEETADIMQDTDKKVGHYTLKKV